MDVLYVLFLPFHSFDLISKTQLGFKLNSGREFSTFKGITKSLKEMYNNHSQHSV